MVTALTRADCPAWFVNAYASPGSEALSAGTVDRVIRHLDATGVHDEASAIVARTFAEDRAVLAATQGRVPVIGYLESIGDYLQALL